MNVFRENLRGACLDTNVKPVPEAAWQVRTNGELISLAERSGFEVLLTVDKDLRTSRTWQGRKIAIIIVACQIEPTSGRLASCGGVRRADLKHTTRADRTHLASNFEHSGYKLAEGKGPVKTTGMRKPHLRVGRDSKELWKSMEKSNPGFGEVRRMGPNSKCCNLSPGLTLTLNEPITKRHGQPACSYSLCSPY